MVASPQFLPIITLLQRGFSPRLLLLSPFQQISGDDWRRLSCLAMQSVGGLTLKRTMLENRLIRIAIKRAKICLFQLAYRSLKYHVPNLHSVVRSEADHVRYIDILTWRPYSGFRASFVSRYPKET